MILNIIRAGTFVNEPRNKLYGDPDPPGFHKRSSSQYFLIRRLDFPRQFINCPDTLCLIVRHYIFLRKKVRLTRRISSYLKFSLATCESFNYRQFECVCVCVATFTPQRPGRSFKLGRRTYGI